MQFSVNLVPASGIEAMWNVIYALKTLGGWLSKADSDGTTYSSTGGQVTGANTGAHGLYNTKAWERLQTPDGVREIVTQQQSSPSANNNYAMRWKYSKSAKFTGGSPTATKVPSATDEQVLWGGGTDSSPTFDPIFQNQDGINWQHIGVQDAPPYAWYCVMWTFGGGLISTGMLFDSTSPFGGGTDADPYVLYLAEGDSSFGNVSSVFQNLGTGIGTSSSTLGAKAWIGSSFKGVGLGSICVYNDSGSLRSLAVAGKNIGGGSGPGAGSDPFSGYDDTQLAFWARVSSDSAPAGLKGLSKLCRWQTVTRKNGQLLQLSNPGDLIAVGDLALPWPGASTLVGR